MPSITFADENITQKNNAKKKLINKEINNIINQLKYVK